jgi:hypothetical protein
VIVAWMQNKEFSRFETAPHEWPPTIATKHLVRESFVPLGIDPEFENFDHRRGRDCPTNGDCVQKFAAKCLASTSKQA